MAFHIVCGPPGSGKSTFVERNRRYGAIVWDFDSMWTALTGLPAYEQPAELIGIVIKVRDAAMNVLVRSAYRGDIWVIATAAKRSEREALRGLTGGDVVVLEASPTTCHKHIADDPRRRDRHMQWREIVDKWWRRYEADPRDIVIRS